MIKTKSEAITTYTEKLVPFYEKDDFSKTGAIFALQDISSMQNFQKFSFEVSVSLTLA